MSTLETEPPTVITSATDTAPAKPIAQGLVLVVACAAMAMVGLDRAIVNVALPSIQQDLGLAQGALHWVVVAYGLLLGGFLLFGGRMTDQLERRRIFLSGLAWLATTITTFVGARAGGRLAGRMGGRRLLITGLSVFTAGCLWLIRVPADGSYLTDLLPAFLLAGIGFGLIMPALQIGALTGVSESDAGLASGLVETMREIGGAAGVAGVSTVLVAGASLDGFHTAFGIIAGLAVLGIVIAAVGFARHS